jgi:hypothetical protein
MADQQAAAPAPAPTEEVDEFAQVFAHLAEGGDPATGVGTDKPAAKLEGEGGTNVEGVDGGDAATTPPAPAPAPVAPAEAPAAPAEAPAPAPTVEAPPPAPAPAPAAATPTAAAPPAPEFEVYTPEEKTQLADLAKEWPDLDKLFELKARKSNYELMQVIFTEVNKALTPLSGYVDHVTTADHNAAIYEGVEDYDQVVTPFKAWVDQQKGVKRRLLTEVVKEGTADEVIEAINEFKTATGWKTPTAAAPAPAAPAPAPAAARTLSEAAQRAAAVLAPVNGKRSVMATAGDPNDFDAAFEEAVAAEEAANKR